MCVVPRAIRVGGWERFAFAPSIDALPHLLGEVVVIDGGLRPAVAGIVYNA